MDTLNSRLEVNSSVSASETHSEKTASDDEDFKANIPFLEEAGKSVVPNTSLIPASPQQQSDRYKMLTPNIEADEDEPNNYNYSQWEADDVDNMSNMGTEYESYGPQNETNFYASPVNSTSAANPVPNTYGYAQDSDNTSSLPEIKFTPKELLLQSQPSSSSSPFSSNYSPLHSSRHFQTHPASHHSAFGPTSHAQMTHQLAYGASSSNYSSQHAPAFHPNMWHPNAPYGSAGNYGYYGPYGAHRYAAYNNRYHAQDPMMDMLQLSNSGREARNRAEKNRRDKLNGSIQELSTMVPHVAESPRRVDKTAVLRFAAHGLRLQYVFGDAVNQTRPQVTDSLMKLLDSFFITLTCHGQIVLISSSIEQHLGHCQADLYGQNILHITHPEDHAMLKQLLIPTDLENLFDIQPEDDSGEPRPRTHEEEDYIDSKLREDKRNFTVRLARAGPRSEPTTYEIVKFDGCFRRSDAAPRGIKTSTFPSTLQLIRRSRGRDDAIPLHTISGNDIVLVALARIIRPPKVINRVMDSTLEYKTRHLIDGRIIDCDQRIGLVAGYMTDEVRNLSPFTFMHQDDVRWVIVALRQMYDCNSSYGQSTYRLLTRNGNFIYLQSNGYLEIDKSTNKVHSFVCINKLLDEEEGRQRVQEMKNKFSVIIKTNIPQSCIDAPASDNPQQLEKAVLCLIQNLQKSSDDEEDVDASSSGYASGSAEALRERNSGHLRQHMLSSRAATLTQRATKTPPLALVPPEAASVKNSISKSVSVVNVTAAKNFRGNQRVRSPMSTTSDEGGSEVRYDFELNTSLAEGEHDCTCQLGEGDCKYCQSLAINQQILSPDTLTPAVARTTSLSTTAGIKRTISCCSTEDEEQQQGAAKRRLKSTEIEQVLTSSLDQIGRTLNQQLSVAKELRDQGNFFEVPNKSCIDEIMEEHQKQSELYVNIKSEYEVQLQSKAIDASTTTACASTSSTMSPTEPQNNRDLKPR